MSFDIHFEAITYIFLISYAASRFTPRRYVTTTPNSSFSGRRSRNFIYAFIAVAI